MQAKELGLVDEIGGEVEARVYLAQKHGIGDTTPVRDLRPGGLYARTVGAAMTGLRGLLFGDLTAGAWAIWPGRNLIP